MAENKNKFRQVEGGKKFLVILFLFCTNNVTAGEAGRGVTQIMTSLVLKQYAYCHFGDKVCGCQEMANFEVTFFQWPL